MSETLTHIGTACSVGNNRKTLCVMDYAAQYETDTEIMDSHTIHSNAISSDTAGIASTSLGTYIETGTARANTAEADATVWTGDLSESHLTALADELIAETNLLRENPAAYAEKLIQLRPYYEENLVRIPGHPVVEVTEGVAALDEAIAVLLRTQSLEPLEASEGMAAGADDHAEDLGDRGMVGHYGSDGSDPFMRISRYGSWDHIPGNVVGENITYGQATLAEWHVIQLLVDDNVPSRGHRKALLKPKYERVGSACEEHPDFRIVCVMTYAGDYQEDS